MKTRILIGSIFGAILLQYASLQANAQTSDDSTQPPEPGSEAIKIGEKLNSPKLSLNGANQSPGALLQKDMRKQGLTEFGWDDEKERYVDITEYEVPIAGSFTADSLAGRLNIANLGLSIKAMEKFSEFLGQTTKLQANLSMGGSPVGRLYMKDQEKFQNEMDALEKELAKVKSSLREADAVINSANTAEVVAQRNLDAKIVEQQKIVHDLNRKATYGPATLDRFAIAGDALIRKMDTNYSKNDFQSAARSEKGKASEELQALKAQKDSILSDKLSSAKAEYDSLQAKIAALVAKIKTKKEEAEKYFNEYKETRVSSKYNWRADYDIVGLTPIKYYYGIMPSADGKGQSLFVAGAFAWSPAIERDTRAILHESGQDLEAAKYNERFKPSVLVSKKGEKRIGEWFQEQQPDTFGMGRWYVDQRGVRYWIGCAYGKKGRGAAADASEVAVRKTAMKNLYLCMNVKLQVEGVMSDELTFNQNDSEIANKVNQLASIEREGVDICSKLGSGEFTIKLQDGSESEPIRYYAVKVSEGDVRAAHKAVLQQAESAAKQHEARYRREGVRKAANDYVKAAKDNKAPLGEAYNATKKDLNTSKQPIDPKSQHNAGGGAEGTFILKPATNTPPKGGKIEPFIKGDTSKVPDDF